MLSLIERLVPPHIQLIVLLIIIAAEAARWILDFRAKRLEARKTEKEIQYADTERIATLGKTYTDIFAEFRAQLSSVKAENLAQGKKITSLEAKIVILEELVKVTEEERDCWKQKAIEAGVPEHAI